MNTFRNRITIALVGFLVVGAATSGLTMVGIESLRHDLRRYGSENLQVLNYYDLHVKLEGLYAEYQRVIEDPDSASELDLEALHDGINQLLLSLRAEIERAEIDARGGYHPIGYEGAPATGDSARLESLVDEISATFTAADAANALLRSGRTAEGLALIEEAFDAGLEKKLDAMIAEGIAWDEAEKQAFAERIRGYFKLIFYGAIVSLVALAAVLIGTIVAVAAPYVRSIAFLQTQADKLALGGDLDPAPAALGGDLAKVQAGIVRAAEAQAHLRDERDRFEGQLRERTRVLREEQDALRRVDQVRRDFLADISHELRTPLTLVRGVAEVALLTETSDPKELKTALSRIVDETGHVTRIVDDLFFIARSQAGALDLRTDIVDFAEISQAAAQEGDAIAAQAKGRLAWHGLSESVEVEGDEGRLRQLFTILIDNAFKYGGSNPAVDVDLGVDGEAVAIAIRDHGPGVPEEDLPHVFERLYRGAASRSAGPGGSGLGLALAKSIVEGHGGTISLSNADGGGALACVSLPIFDADALEAATT